jgi:hypothetical protein
MRMRVAAAAPAALALTLAAPVRAHPSWPDGFVARLEAQALLQGLNADLLSHDSATATLQRFCDQHGGRPGLKIAARRMPGPDKPAGEAERRDLQAGPETPLRYRRVALTCGEAILSRADNWYRPDRLTPEMNRLLEETDTPFGVAAAPLAYRRRTLSATVLAHPLPEGWERQPPQANATPWTPPAQILEHRALLTTPDGAPLSLVVETYSATLLALPPAISAKP